MSAPLARARSVAFRWVTGVRASDGWILQRIADGLGPDGVAALAVLLAECCDAARLKAACDAVALEDAGRLGDATAARRAVLEEAARPRKRAAGAA